MGKIRMKTLGLEELEKQQTEDAKKRREAKKVKKAGIETDVAEEKHEAPDQGLSRATHGEKPADTKTEPKKSSKKKAVIVHRHIGKKYKTSKAKVQAKAYLITDAIKLIKEMAFAKFPETVEVHLNLRESGLRGEVALPHGIGKEVRVVVVDETVLKDIEAGKIEFDILIATPAMMPQLVKFAKVLGPKGLMPNPKSGTVTDKPEAAVKKFKSGAVRYASEAKFPLLHQSVGKVSFDDSQLVENIEALLEAVKRKNIARAFISGTMTPSVEMKLD